MLVYSAKMHDTIKVSGRFAMVNHEHEEIIAAYIQLIKNGF